VLQKLWYDRPVRTQLLVAVGLINLLALFVAVSISILNTRTATRVEIEASLEIAQRFVSATIKDLAAQGHIDQLEEQLPLELKHLRHVRIYLMDPMGQLAVVSPMTQNQAQAPRWFANLVRPQLVGRAVRVVSVDGADPVVVVGEPADEIAEAWTDFYSLAIVWVALDALILIVLYIVLGRVLDPLQSLSRGMLRLEDGQYATRLPMPKVKELAVITNRFNTLAEALDVAKEENSRLYRQLTSVQEAERREIANELHDEAGPCLFGITANASSIQTIADRLVDPHSSEINRRVGEILGIVDRLKLMNRALLKKLRPGAHWRVGLTELIDELVADFERRHPGTQILYSAGRLAKAYGEPIDLTLYRSIQEGITNAIRHGHAHDLTVDLAEAGAHRRSGAKGQSGMLRLTISDDGKGIDPATPMGFGLTTMIERVKSLGGTCAIDSAPGAGTTIRIEIPVQREKAERAQTLELVRGVS
jgi:two-component system, NarL family, sensor histidine kinase UhpB